MFKRLTVIVVLLMFLVSTVPAYAADHGQADVQEPVIYERTINVTEDGGVYRVGFTTIRFPKDFIDDEQLNAEIDIKIYMENGVPYIEFNSDLQGFDKAVTINVHSYNGLLYETNPGRNVFIRIKQQTIRVRHFSRYAFS